MNDYERGHLPFDLVPDEIINQCNLLEIVSNEKSYFEIHNGMPGLK